ncbi:hypothetical protein Pmani_022751 [Petrolisthes manimaculis]|uniref:Uncharacterized protein n=1 Tax=Petrolisthes manimaculis TaxID=1843537 RepID=A0AAE1PDE3_9EUCA|nr:hypothetical protein Pmani_022751 [Petrolisthes manimaculis]
MESQVEEVDDEAQDEEARPCIMSHLIPSPPQHEPPGATTLPIDKPYFISTASKATRSQPLNPSLPTVSQTTSRRQVFM